MRREINFELGKRYIVKVTDKGIVPIEEFTDERFFDKDTDELAFLTDEEKAVVVIQALEDVRAEIILLSDKADRECKASNSYSVRDRLRTKAQAYDDVAKMIDQKIKEIEHE